MTPAPLIGQLQYRVALGWQIALALYMQVISWIPLGRWNYQPCCPTGFELLRRGDLAASDAAGAAAFVLPAAFFWVGARRGWRWAMGLSLLATAIWLVLQLVSWWPPYLFGASERWSVTYERAFAQATQVLPRWGRHLPPDAAHLVLQILLIGAVGASAKALLHTLASGSTSEDPNA